MFGASQGRKCTDKSSGGKDIASEVVVARGDPPPILDAAENVFYF
jgi:hypothetical protein